MFGFIRNLLPGSRRNRIGTPRDPVHLTHVRFDPSTREFTGLPSEWAQVLHRSGFLEAKGSRFVMKAPKKAHTPDVRDTVVRAVPGPPPLRDRTNRSLRGVVRGQVRPVYFVGYYMSDPQ